MNETQDYNPFEIVRDKDDIKQLEVTFEELLNARDILNINARRGRGQHGSPALKDSTIPTEIFVRLPWAWEEAEQAVATKEMRYQIIAKCLERASIFVTTETIRKAIARVLEEYPEYS